MELGSTASAASGEVWMASRIEPNQPASYECTHSRGSLSGQRAIIMADYALRALARCVPPGSDSRAERLREGNRDMKLTRHLGLAVVVALGLFPSWQPCGAHDSFLTSQTLSQEGLSATGYPTASLPSGEVSIGRKAPASHEPLTSVTLASNEVEIAQYGAAEDVATYQSAGFLGIRFDPPFAAPYTIKKIRFPSLTINGVPAQFLSVALLGTDVRGAIQAGPALFRIAPYEGSADGVNDVEVNLTVTEPGRVFYWCVEFPSASTPGFPNDYPFLRMDYLDMERGLFANSYRFTPFGGALPTLLRDRNIIASMICSLESIDAVPIAASTNLGANRVPSTSSFFGSIIFSFKQPGDVRANGEPAEKKFLKGTELLYRPLLYSPWRVWTVAGPSSEALTVDSFPNSQIIWSTRSIDRNGGRAVPSSVTITSPFLPGGFPGQPDDVDEPNGRRQDATALTTFPVMRDLTYWPAGDQDYYSLDARPGQVIEATAGRSAPDGANDLDLVMYLYNARGDIVAFDDNSAAQLSPHIRYTVPAPSGSSRGTGAQRFTMHISDIRGSRQSPDSAPRVIVGVSAYVLTVEVLEQTAAAVALAGRSSQGPSLRITGPNPSRTGTTFQLAADGAANRPSVLRIYDSQGRLIRAFKPSARASESISWDGRNDRGIRVAAGAYYAVAEIDGQRQSRRVMILK